MIVFIDESGLKRPCNCIALGAVYFPSKYGETYLDVGVDVLEQIKQMARLRGEVKWRDVKRRAAGAIEVVFSRVEARWTVLHFNDWGDLQRAVARLAAGSRLVVVDHQLLPKGAVLGVRYIERDSRKVPGLQLADVVAGWARDTYC